MRDSTDHNSDLQVGGARPTLATNAEETALTTALLVTVQEQLADFYQYSRRSADHARRVAPAIEALEAGRRALGELLAHLAEERKALEGLEESLNILRALTAPATKWGSS